MNKKLIIIPIVVIIGIIVVFSSDEPSNDDKVIFHATLADPELYVDGVYSEILTIEKGDYSFRFVPNGSSPKILTISIDGENFSFDEEFELNSTLHQTGISEYFTWEYVGTNSFSVQESSEMKISINPNGNTMGSVTVDILEN